jgi:hypothetical protein
MNRWTRLRWHVCILTVIDWLLGTHLLGKATSRWRQELEILQTEINSLQTSLEELNASRGTILRHLCLSYLQLRQSQSPQNWLHFDSRVPSEESAIDVLTRALVTPHWACWRITQVPAENEDLYTYDLVPDWQALHQDALKYAESLPSGLLEWLREYAHAEKKR